MSRHPILAASALLLFVAAVATFAAAWLVATRPAAPIHSYQPQDPFIINAIMSGATESDINRLIADGESPSARRSDSAPAIVVAAEAGRADLVRLLIQHGASVNEKTYQDLTALHIAAVQDLGMCIVLLDLGADIDAPSGISGAPPLMDAATDGSLSLTKLFLDRGADPCVRLKSGKTISETISVYLEGGFRMDSKEVAASLELIKNAAARKGCGSSPR